jgi:hypothetical protein
LPTYDHAIRDLLGRAARVRDARTLVLHDPRAGELPAHWSEVTGLKIMLKPGL